MAFTVLGLSMGHDGSACVVVDGKLKAAIATERLTRFKKERGVNKQTIKYVLNKSGIKFKDIDMVSISNWFWDRDMEGNELFDKAKEGLSVVTENGIEYSLEDHATFYQNGGMVAQGMYTFNVDDQSKPCMFVDHHFAHCAYTYYMSPYDDALCLSVDFSDQMGASHSVYYFNDDLLIFRPLRKGGDFSVGSYYGQMCDFLGFFPSLTDAGKVMALAAYGTPHKDCESISWPDVTQTEDMFHGDMYLHTLLKHNIKLIPDQRVFYPQLKGEGGTKSTEWLNKKDWNSIVTKDIAATTQKVLETSVKNFVDKLHETASSLSNNLCLAGGTMLNCVTNGRLLNESEFENVYLAPAAGDDGLSIGGAMFVSHMLDKNRKKEINQHKRHKTTHSVLEVFEGGKSYDDDEVQEALSNNASDISWVKMVDDKLVDLIVDDIDQGKVVGWFQGGSELGPRALGHRSILGDARDPDMKDKINNKVKHREEFRPFAPVVPLEDADAWFELSNHPSPYMLFSVKCKQPELIPSGVHIDDTSRVQTVTKEDNGRFYQLVRRFGDKTKVPVIINTSFNVQGQPIVESPADAIKCFLKTEIDVLVLENYVVEKK